MASNEKLIPDVVTDLKKQEKEKGKKKTVKEQKEEKAVRTKYENYKIETIHRSKLKNAPYNPREITDEARRKLKTNIENPKIGLIDPIVWNKRTGNIVSGHQRVGALDSLEGKQNYLLTASVVDMDEKTEKEQNIFMNNPEAQGYFSVEKLELMVKDPKITIENTGFSLANIYQMFGDSPLAESPALLEEMANKLRAARAVLDKMRENEEKKSNSDLDYYFVVVFANDKAREEFSKRLGITDNRYMDGRFLQHKMFGDTLPPDANKKPVPRGKHEAPETIKTKKKKPSVKEAADAKAST